MRLLLDSCVWGPAVDELRAAGHDTVAIREWPRDPGDDEILRFCHEDRRVLVTLDKDFGELVFVLGRPHAGILRLVGIRARDQAVVVLRVIEKHGGELQDGALIVAEADRIRIRTADNPRNGV